MNTAQKALLFSAFVFPGSGYFVLQRKFRAYCCSIISLACFFTLVAEAIYKAHILSEAIMQDILLRGELSFNILDIRQQIAITPGYLPAWLVETCTGLLVGLWLAALLDTYRLSKQKP